MRPGVLPLVGAKSMEAVFAPKAEMWSWQPTDAVVSSGGDLGYSYGVIQIGGRAASEQAVAYEYYLRIWKRQPAGDWKVVLEAANPGPPPQ